MKTLLAIIPLLLASCADKVPPRAIIAPVTIIEAVDSKPVEQASAAVSDAAEKVADANRKASQANDKALSASASLKEAMNKLRITAEGNKILMDAWQEAERFAVDLGEELLATRRALNETNTESEGLRSAIKSLSAEVSTLKASAAVNKSTSDTLRAENKTLRAQAEQGNAARDDLLKLQASSKEREKTLKRLAWKLGIAAASLAITTALLGYLLLKP